MQPMQVRLTWLSSVFVCDRNHCISGLQKHKNLNLQGNFIKRKAALGLTFLDGLFSFRYLVSYNSITDRMGFND